MIPDAPAPLPPPALDRARLPEVLRVEDVAAVLGVKASAARKAVARGDCGPFVRLGRRMLVRRESFLASLAARESAPPPAPSRIVPPKPKPEFVALLHGRGSCARGPRPV